MAKDSKKPTQAPFGKSGERLVTAMLSYAFAFIALLVSLSPIAACAQSIRWDPPGGTLAVGETTTLQLIFDGCDPKGTPLPPPVDGLTCQFSGKSSNISWINGDYSKTVSLSYAVLLTKNQSIDLPSFAIDTDKGSLRTPAAHFDPGAATVGGTGQSLESATDSRLETLPESVWAGEVFTLNYSIEATRNYYADFGRGVFTWNAAPLIAEDWSRPEAFDVNSGGQPRSGLAYHTRALIRTPGRHPVNPISQLVNLNVGVTGFGFFQQRQYQQFSVASNTPTIEVRALPSAPAGFSGAVGDFKLVSKLVPASAAVGEPVTWTLQLSGSGNWPDIQGLPAREVSKDFQVIQPQAKRTPEPGKLFDATLSEDIVLVPTRPGRYDLGSVEFVYFEPASGSYKTLQTPSASITISGTAASGTVAGGGQPATAAGTIPRADLTAAPPPTELPRDPLPDTDATASLPLPSGKLAALLAAPFAALLLFWLWLALRRAQETDPRRARREACNRLAATLKDIRGMAGRSTPGLSTLLLQWQHDSTVLWEISHAAPSPRHFAAFGSVPAAQAWATLWTEADQTLYSIERPLPDDWAVRAEAALAASPPPPFAPRKLFLPRNLFPFLLAAGLVFSGTPSRTQAQDASEPQTHASVSGAASYRSGDFSAAEIFWRNVLKSPSAPPSAHYNLSLALAQQNHWDEAAAHASAAFVQDPSNPAVRWQFTLACDKADFAPAPLVEFVSPGPVQRLARIASPAGWQWAMFVSAVLIAAALAFGLALSYRSRSGGRAALIAAAAALLLFLTATAGWRAYGSAADSRAVVVWRAGILRSIPTEADTAQKTTPLAAGSVAIVNKSFLGWVRLSFENGETGWVRVEEAVPFWGRQKRI
jgi:hypothetical protein